MPIFDFQCPKCQKEEVDVLIRNDADIPVCISCTAEMTKQVSAPMGVVSGTDTPTKYKNYKR